MAGRREGKRVPMPETVIHVTPRLRSNDCATWALSVYLNLPYAEVLKEVEKVDRKEKGGKGLFQTQILTIAKALGFPLKIKTPKRVNLSEDVGMLNVTFPDLAHIVVLKAGQIIDTDSTIWDAESFLEAKEATPGSLLYLPPST